jgi:hypothetical protein
MDKRKNNGGHSTKGRAGRPSKNDEDKAKNLIKAALKKLYKKDGDDENTIMFLHDFAQTTRGQQFIAEHLLGKPKEKVESTVTIASIEPVEWV